jgi:hypothetical protein
MNSGLEFTLHMTNTNPSIPRLRLLYEDLSFSDERNSFQLFFVLR